MWPVNCLRAAWAGVRVGLMLMTCILVLGYIFAMLFTPEVLRAGIDEHMMISSPVGWVVGIVLCFMFARKFVTKLVG
jgi:hypothetical protein